MPLMIISYILQYTHIIYKCNVFIHCCWKSGRLNLLKLSPCEASSSRSHFLKTLFLSLSHSYPHHLHFSLSSYSMDDDDMPKLEDVVNGDNNIHASDFNDFHYVSYTEVEDCEFHFLEWLYDAEVGEPTIGNEEFILVKKNVLTDHLTTVGNIKKIILLIVGATSWAINDNVIDDIGKEARFSTACVVQLSRFITYMCCLYNKSKEEVKKIICSTFNHVAPCHRRLLRLLSCLQLQLYRRQSAGCCF